jgi:hypothetical protein
MPSPAGHGLGDGGVSVVAGGAAGDLTAGLENRGGYPDLEWLPAMMFAARFVTTPTRLAAGPDRMAKSS